jgi:NADPH2:quinone reductase
LNAWIIKNFNGIENATLTHLPDPVPGDGEVLMRVKFAALNPADAYLAKAQYPAKPALPHVLGRDGVGEIVALGSDVRGVGIGDKRAILRGEVGVSRYGTFAELVAVPVESLIEIPHGWSDEQAAGAALVYLTAYQAITQWNDLPSADCVTLISGASGGVGVASIHLARALGHTTIGLSRDSHKREILQNQIGANLTLDPADPTWREQLKKYLAGKKVNLIIDNVGGGLFNEMLATLDMNGRVSVVGRLAGEVPNFNTASLFFRRLRIGGVAVGTFTNAESRTAWNEIVHLLDKINAKPIVDEIFPFDRLPASFERLARGPMGKVLLKTT